MNRARISSKQCQYPRNAWEDQQPWAMTTHGSVLSSRRCVVPPIRKPWPLTEVRPSLAHILLQCSKNHILFIGAQVLSDVSNANKGEDAGMLVLEERWCLKAEIALQLHLESDMCMVVPFSSVFECG